MSSLRISPGEQLLISVRKWDDPVFESENGGTRADKRRAKQRVKDDQKQLEKQLRKSAAKGGGALAIGAGGGGSSADAVDDNA